MAHARLSPSHSTTWLNCPGSINLSAGIPDTSSSYADDGSDTHELAALCLTVGCDAEDMIGKTLPNGGLVDADRAERAQMYLNAVRMRGEDGLMLVEQFLDLSRWYGEEGGGTADAITFRNGLLSVIDLKDGVTPVAPESPQLKIYGLGALGYMFDNDIRMKEVKQISLVIVQPKVHDQPQEYITTVDDLQMSWGREVLIPGAAATRDPDAPRIPGEAQCKWCKAKGICPELAAANAVVVYGEGAHVSELRDYGAPPAPSTMPSEALASITAKEDMVIAWMKAVREETQRRLMEGDADIAKHFKLVKGKRGNRKWAPDMEAEVATVLKANYGLAPETIYKMELLSPAQVLKLPVVKEAPGLLDVFITQADGGVGLAPLSDKRPAALPERSAEDVFSTIEIIEE